MKYKVLANGTLMEENISSLRAMNLVMNILKANNEPIEIKVYYLAKFGQEWKLENSVKVNF